jgi:hypothetical protein
MQGSTLGLFSSSQYLWVLLWAVNLHPLFIQSNVGLHFFVKKIILVFLKIMRHSLWLELLSQKMG